VRFGLPDRPQAGDRGENAREIARILEGLRSQRSRPVKSAAGRKYEKVAPDGLNAGRDALFGFSR